MKTELTKFDEQMINLCTYVTEFEYLLSKDLDTHYQQILIIKQAQKVKKEYLKIKK